tara:strand:- start:2965 stop:3288 length:324 start_codon:yes stop_codon:yes gene_type:complete
MTNPDYRALCAELVGAYEHELNSSWKRGMGCDLLNRARAALAEPEPVAPTDEDIMELMPQQMRDDLATAARVQLGFDNPKAAAACRIILNRHAVDHARAVLAKWGHQ